MEPSRLGIIDLGSNSVSLAIMELKDHAYDLILEVKAPARLAEGMGSRGVLRPAAVARAVEAVRNMAALCRARGVGEILPIATAALRGAANRDAVLGELKAATGLAFRVISGEEEARLDYLAVINTVALTDGLIIDVGGASTELVGVRDRKLWEAACLPLGAVTLTEGLGDPNRIVPDELGAVESRVNEALAALPWLKDYRGLPLVGLGGTLRNLAKVHRRGRRYPFPVLHHYEMDPADLAAVYHRLAGLTLRGREKVPGLSASRADIIVAGAAVPVALSRTVAPSRVVISGSGLRNGLFYQWLAASRSRPDDMGLDGVLQDPVTHSALNALRRCRGAEAHALRVSRLALSLFDQLRTAHGLGGGARARLAIASLLHDVGMIIDCFEHARHSAYIILHGGVRGVGHADLLAAAAVAALHHGGNGKGQPWALRDLLPLEDPGVQRLAVLLRLAEALDHPESGAVSAVACDIVPGEVRLRLQAAPGRREEACLAANEAGGCSDAFTKAFGRKLRITPIPPTDDQALTS